MRTIWTIPFIIFFLFTCSSSKTGFDTSLQKSAEEVSLLIINELLSRPDFMLYDTEDVYALHYAEVCAAYGALKLAKKLNKEQLSNALVRRYEEATPALIPNSANHVDANVYGVLPLEVFIQTRDTAYLKQGMEFADDQWANPLPNGLSSQTRYWIDDIYMIGLLQAQAYRASGKMIYLERAALEIDAYISKLQQANGLFYHGSEAPFYWGRGNGWVAAGLAELLTVLPQSNPHYPTILAAYKKMMQTLLEHQSEDGMWHQVIDHPESFKESSSSAMFAFAMATGVKKNILPKEPYTTAYLKAWATLTTYLDENGRMQEVCVGTGQSKDINYYFNRPRSTGDFHGQAPMLWLADVLISN